jgi:cell division protein FtsB
MLNKKNKNFNNIVFNQKFLTIIGLFIIALIVFPLAKNISQRHKINNEIKNLEQDIKELENNNNELKKLINYLDSDQFAEEQARLNLGLKKQGETAIVIEGLADKFGESENSSGSIIKIPWLNSSISRDNMTNVQKWLVYFFQ